MKRPTMDQQERHPRKRPEMRRCSICWEWVEHVGFIHDKRCMACEGTGYVDCDPSAADGRPDHCKVPGLRWQSPETMRRRKRAQNADWPVERLVP